MSRESPPYLVVGHLVRAHGTAGEIYVRALTDHPESTFAPGVVLRLADGAGQQPDPFHAPVTLTSVRPFKDGYLVVFEGVSDRSAARRLAGRALLRPFEEARALAADEVFYHQLLGMSVETTDGRTVGRVVQVYELHPADLVEVEAPDGRRLLIPLTRHIVEEMDPGRDRLVIDPPEGLLDL